MVDNQRKINIGVIFGGMSSEHEVSLMSARSILAVLPLEKYHIIPVGITYEGTWWSGEGVLEKLARADLTGLTRVMLMPEPGHNRLYAIQESQGAYHLTPFAELDVVFPVLHGPFGEDGNIQGLFETAGIPYVGGGVAASAVGMDKALFKDMMRAQAIPVVDARVILRSEVDRDIEAVIEAIEGFTPYPLFVKPVNMGSSIGINKCHQRSELRTALLEAARYDRRLLVERGIQAREIEVSVLGNRDLRASIPGEVIPGDEFYSYNAKYYNESSKTIIPADLPAALIGKIQEYAVGACRAIDCAGMARVDFLVDRNTLEIYVSEINTIPGFTRISMYPKLWEASGISYPELLERLIELALERKKDSDRNQRKFEGNKA